MGPRGGKGTSISSSPDAPDKPGSRPPSVEGRLTSLALVSDRQPAIAAPPVHWAHDVRNVLASVGLHLDTLARLSGPHGAKAAYAGHALISKVSALCNVALIGDPNGCSQRQPFEITAMIRHVVDLLAPAAPDGFRVNIVSDAPAYVLADQNEIFRVLFNHLHNALTVARAAPASAVPG